MVSNLWRVNPENNGQKINGKKPNQHGRNIHVFFKKFINITFKVDINDQYMQESFDIQDQQ